MEGAHHHGQSGPFPPPRMLDWHRNRGARNFREINLRSIRASYAYQLPPMRVGWSDEPAVPLILQNAVIEYNNRAIAGNIMLFYTTETSNPSLPYPCPVPPPVLIPNPQPPLIPTSYAGPIPPVPYVPPVHVAAMVVDRRPLPLPRNAPAPQLTHVNRGKMMNQ